MTQIELSSGPVEYTDTGGSGPVLVFLQRLMMDASLWDDVIADLSTPGGTQVAAAASSPDSQLAGSSLVRQFQAAA